VEKLEVHEQACTLLYTEGDLLTLMDTESFEQFTVDRGMAGEAAVFLREGMALTVDMIEGAPAAVRLPPTMSLTVAEADAVVKGQTASSSYKPAVLDNGLKVMVPPHIEAGTRIVVNTTDSSYVERAKD
jgi:elongation factor P